MCLRRSVSDSITLLDALEEAFPSLTLRNDNDNSVVNETCNVLESACTYGPNSPRKKSNLTFIENATVSALSESVSEDTTHCVDENPRISATTHCDWGGDDCNSVGDLNTEKKALKRHSGQRSRVRKLQYIAELERTVDVLQNLESGLSVRVAALLEQHVSLSMENSKLKQQMARLQQEKLMMDREYLSLKKQLERLKLCPIKSRNSKVSTYCGSGAAETSRAEATW